MVTQFCIMKAFLVVVVAVIAVFSAVDAAQELGIGCPPAPAPGPVAGAAVTIPVSGALIGMEFDVYKVLQDINVKCSLCYFSNWQVQPTFHCYGGVSNTIILGWCFSDLSRSSRHLFCCRCCSGDRIFSSTCTGCRIGDYHTGFRCVDCCLSSRLFNCFSEALMISCMYSFF
nr:hypothetical protein Iba_chr14aCG14480 [Ipomoea batatas]